MRPCHEEHEPSPSVCPMCAWCASPTEMGYAYRQLWDEPEPAPSRHAGPAVMLSEGCIYLGTPHLDEDGNAVLVDCGLG